MHRFKRGPRKSYHNYERDGKRKTYRNKRMYDDKELNAIVANECERVRRSMLSKARTWKHNKDALEKRNKSDEEMRHYDDFSDVEIVDDVSEFRNQRAKVSQEDDNCSLSPADKNLLDSIDLSDGELIEFMNEDN